MATTVALVGQLTLIDSVSGTQALSKQLTNLNFTGSVSELSQSTSLASGSTAISLPVSPVQFLYIKNLHLSNTITITWTPLSGASNVVSTLEPGGFIFYGNQTTGGGITALSLNASGANTTIEYLLVG